MESSSGGGGSMREEAQALEEAGEEVFLHHGEDGGRGLHKDPIWT